MSNINTIIDLSEKIGSSFLPNEINEVKNKVFKLVEERGVAAFPYKKVINEIFDFIKKQCTTISDVDGEKNIDIPTELTSKIDFIDNLIITVNIINSTKENTIYNSGSGVTNFRINDKLINKKINWVKIEITCYCYYGFLMERTVYNSLYHELNHCYDAYNDLLKNGYYKRWINQLEKSNIQFNNIFKDKEDNELFELILYRLFSETEFNALVSSVYGDLQGLKSIRQNFQHDIQLTQAYYIWKYIGLHYKSLFKKIDENNITKIKNIFNTYQININSYGNSLDSFKKEIIRKTTYLLNDLIKKIGKTASLYYDNKEEKPLNKIMTHTDKNTTINYV